MPRYDSRGWPRYVPVAERRRKAERMAAKLAKKGLSREVLEGGGEALLTELGDTELLRLVSLDIHRALAEG